LRVTVFDFFVVYVLEFFCGRLYIQLLEEVGFRLGWVWVFGMGVLSLDRDLIFTYFTCFFLFFFINVLENGEIHRRIYPKKKVLSCAGSLSKSSPQG